MDMCLPNRIPSFDSNAGELTVDAGVLLGNIIRVSLPRGWLLHVTPGMQWVTVGGAIASDVHGKNHHRVGPFSCYVQCFVLVIPGGEEVFCSPDVN